MTRWRSVVAAVAAVAPARGSPSRLDGSRWTRRIILLLTCGGIVAAASVLATLLAVAEFHHVYFNRHNLPDLGPFTRFEFPTIGHVYDADGRPLIELAREHREIARYKDIPPIVRDAILAAEDKRFFSHNGIADGPTPRSITVYHGTEFMSCTLEDWAYHRGVQLDFIRPGKPVENAFIGAFNGRLRDECLNVHQFTSIADAQTKIEAWCARLQCAPATQLARPPDTERVCRPTSGYADRRRNRVF